MKEFDEKLVDVAPLASALHPAVHILDSRYQYTPSTKTDVTVTWRKYGWKPLAEQKKRTK